MEKAMAPHSSTPAWKTPWTEEPGGLQSMGSKRVGHDWATSFSLFTFMHWRRKWQPTPVFLPGESQGRGSLVGWRLWGRTESDTTDATTHHRVAKSQLWVRPLSTLVHLSLSFYLCIWKGSEAVWPNSEKNLGSQCFPEAVWFSLWSMGGELSSSGAV